MIVEAGMRAAPAFEFSKADGLLILTRIVLAYGN